MEQDIDFPYLFIGGPLSGRLLTLKEADAELGCKQGGAFEQHFSQEVVLAISGVTVPILAKCRSDMTWGELEVCMSGIRLLVGIEVRK